MKSGNGLRGRDKKASDEMMGRVAAARISKWFERLVLPGQEIMIDAPHLVSRYPSLLQGDPSDVETWNKTANFERFDRLGLEIKKIEDFRLKKDFWLSRPVWFWEKLSDFSEIKEVSEPWERKPTDFLFCEDSSCFYKREDCREFRADVELYTQRFLRSESFKGVEYRPKVRLI